MKRALWVYIAIVLGACTPSASVQLTATPDSVSDGVQATAVGSVESRPTDTPVGITSAGDTASVTPLVSRTDAGGVGTTASPTMGVTDTPVVVSATPTVVRVARIATGWRFEQVDTPGALFFFAGVRCATNGADVSGEWVIEANPVIEGIPFTGRYVVVVNPDQQSGTWQYEQFFTVEDVKSLARVAGQVAAVRVGLDGSVSFDLRVEGAIEGRLITPDGESAMTYPYPVTTLTNLTWQPIVDACP